MFVLVGTSRARYHFLERFKLSARVSYSLKSFSRINLRGIRIFMHTVFPGLNAILTLSHYLMCDITVVRSFEALCTLVSNVN